MSQRILSNPNLVGKNIVYQAELVATSDAEANIFTGVDKCTNGCSKIWGHENWIGTSRNITTCINDEAFRFGSTLKMKFCRVYWLVDLWENLV